MLLKEIKNIISKWGKILNRHKPEENKSPNNNQKSKPNIKSENKNESKGETPSKKQRQKEQKEKQKEEEEIPDKLIFEDDSSVRNNTRKKLFKNLKTCLENDIEKDKKLEYLIEKVIDIEKLIYEKYKGEGPYTSRVLEILHNIKNNEEFKKKIVDGTIKPDELAIMEVFDMLDNTQKDKIHQEKEDKVNSVRSDWNQKHTKPTSGVYKCRKCGCDKTTQFEMQTRSADEPMTLFITCVDCGNSWKMQKIISNALKQLNYSVNPNIDFLNK